MKSVEIVIPVLNEERSLVSSVSKLNSFLDTIGKNYTWIIHIVDNGSEDSTPDILEKYGKNDKRIKIITQENKGLTKSLNIGINNSSGKYIARQDADDISYPERIDNQVNAFENDSNLILLGTRANINFKGFIYESP